MEVSFRAFKRWWGEDVYRSGLLVGGFLFGAFWVQGLPYWDCDYSVNFEASQGRSLLGLIGQWLSPINNGTADWGFLDRQVQFIVYNICYKIAGYHPWPYLLFRTACYAGLGVMIYAWALRLIPETRNSKRAAAAAALFFLFAPGPVASMVWLADFGPTAEFVFLVLTFVLWRQIEVTPIESTELSPLSNPEQRRWLYRWVALSFAVYLGYKTKADLKLIPLIFSGYIVLLRAKQWKLFGVPIALMFALAVPWSSHIFTNLPPFLPHSGARPAGYSWAPASFDVVKSFLWSPNGYNFMDSWKRGAFSLGGLLGPFLLSAMLAFMFWRFRSFSGMNWKWAESSQSRARVFVLLWFGAMLVGVSALPVISDFFRIRWAILTFVPVSILLAWIFSLFAESWVRLPRWAAVGCIALFAVQTSINFSRSVYHRRELSQATIAIDQVYADAAKKFPTEELALGPGFLPYAYRSDAGPAFRNRDVLGSWDDLSRRHTPNKTSVISWEPPLLDQLDVVGVFTGCGSSLFEAIFSCPQGQDAFLTRYILEDFLLQAARSARAQNDLVGSRRLYEMFLVGHPGNLAARFQDGLLAYQQRDWGASEQAFADLEKYVPNNPSVLFNRAVAMIELKQNGPAIVLLKRVLQMHPQDRSAQTNLYRAYVANGNRQEAAAMLQEMSRPVPVPTAASVNRDSTQNAKLLGDLAAAEKSAKLFPTPENFLNLSLQLNRNQGYQDSIAAARKALKLRPGYADAYNNIAAAYEALGSWDEAIQAAQEALRLKPDFQLARNNLEWSLSQKKLHDASVTKVP